MTDEVPVGCPYKPGDVVRAFRYDGTPTTGIVRHVTRIRRREGLLDYLKLTFKDGGSIFKLAAEEGPRRGRRLRRRRPADLARAGPGRGGAGDNGGVKRMTEDFAVRDLPPNVDHTEWLVFVKIKDYSIQLTRADFETLREAVVQHELYPCRNVRTVP